MAPNYSLVDIVVMELVYGVPIVKYVLKKNLEVIKTYNTATKLLLSQNIPHCDKNIIPSARQFTLQRNHDGFAKTIILRRNHYYFPKTSHTITRPLFFANAYDTAMIALLLRRHIAYCNDDKVKCR